MAHIVLVVGEYHPYFSAVGVCCRNIAEALEAENNVVTVVCMKSRADEPAVDDYRRQRIVRVSTASWSMRLRLEDRIRASANLQGGWLHSMVSTVLHLLLNCVRVAGAARSLLSTTSINGSSVRAFLTGLTRIEDPIDLLIPFCFPMEAVVAGMKYTDMHPRTQLVPYLFDPFVHSRTMHRTSWNMRLKESRHVEIERQMMARATKVFCVSHLLTHFEQYREWAHKLVVTEHPLLKRVARSNARWPRGDGILKLAYAGLFDGRVRDPDYFLRLMLDALPKMSGHLDLYVGGNCGRSIDAYCARSSGRIRNNGFFPKEEVDVALMSCDVLISVGNIGTPQVPSKLIEYAATGKPIVYFYSAEGDQGKALLQRYPLSLCVRQDDRLLFENTELVVEFCRRVAGRVLDFAEVGRIFADAQPDVIARKILDVVA